MPVHVRVNTGLAGGEVITISEKQPCISDFPCGADVYLRPIELPFERAFAPCEP